MSRFVNVWQTHCVDLLFDPLRSRSDHMVPLRIRLSDMWDCYKETEDRPRSSLTIKNGSSSKISRLNYRMIQACLVCVSCLRRHKRSLPTWATFWKQTRSVHFCLRASISNCLLIEFIRVTETLNWERFETSNSRLQLTKIAQYKYSKDSKKDQW